MQNEWVDILGKLIVVDILIGVIVFFFGALAHKGSEYAKWYMWVQFEWLLKLLTYIIKLPFRLLWTATQWSFKKLLGIPPKKKKRRTRT